MLNMTAKLHKDFLTRENQLYVWLFFVLFWSCFVFLFFFTFLHMVLYASEPEFLLESHYMSVHSAGFPSEVQHGESVIGIVTKIIKS